MFQFADHEGVQGASEDYRQKERIRKKLPNSKQDCVKNQEVDGQEEVERDWPGYEIEQVIDAVHPKEVHGAHLG